MPSDSSSSPWRSRVQEGPDEPPLQAAAAEVDHINLQSAGRLLVVPAGEPVSTASRRHGRREGSSFHCLPCSYEQRGSARSMVAAVTVKPVPARTSPVTRSRGAQSIPPAATGGNEAACSTADHSTLKEKTAPMPPRSRSGPDARNGTRDTYSHCA